MIIKVVLLVISFIIMTIIVFSFEKFRQDWLIYYLTFGIVLGQVLFPVWFFQGMERMKYITYLNITAKLIFTFAIFVFIRQESDYIYVPFLNFMGSLVAGALALWIVFKDFNVNFKLPSIIDIKHHLKEGWYIFVSTMAISLYTTSNTFILGLFTNNTFVGYYSGAEKIIKSIQGLLSPVSQSIYPHISKLASESKEKAIKFIRKTTLLVGGASFVFSSVIFIFADLIVRLLLGTQYQESIVVLRILAFVPFLVALTNMFGAQLLLPFNIKRLFTFSIIIPSVLHIVLLFFAASIFKEIGVSILVVFTESLILVFRMSGLYLFHKDLFLGVVQMAIDN
jgi:PST family polysaccharide transporter